eukprot:g7908.t1
MSLVRSLSKDVHPHADMQKKQPSEQSGPGKGCVVNPISSSTLRSRAMTSLADMHEFLDDVNRIYAQDKEDLELVRKIRENQELLENHCAETEDKWASRLKVLQQRCEELRKQSQAEFNKELLIKQEEELTGQAERLHEQILELQRDIGLSKSKVEGIQQNIAHLEERYEKLQSEAHETIPASQRTLKLYQKIAPITWDFSAGDGSIKGKVHQTNSKSIVKLDISQANKSPYEIATILWDTLERDFENGLNGERVSKVTLIR